MPLRNRVDPWGDLHAVDDRGMFTGNRGCLVDAEGRVVRHHQTAAWITCALEFRSRHHPLAELGVWTPVFFLDEAVALSAGHRPCGECRRADYVSYRDAAGAAIGAPGPMKAGEMHRQLATERLRPGRGLDRGRDRILRTATLAELPVGTVVVGAERQPFLVGDGVVQPFGFGGWGPPLRWDPSSIVDVLTPPLSVGALRRGYAPMLHPSAATHKPELSDVHQTWT